jgi:hypothetical protein
MDQSEPVSVNDMSGNNRGTLTKDDKLVNFFGHEYLQTRRLADTEKIASRLQRI